MAAGPSPPTLSPTRARSACRSASTGSQRRSTSSSSALGMDVELEHGLHDLATNVTGDDPGFAGKIALAHLNEFPDYYTRLDRMEAEAKRDHARE